MPEMGMKLSRLLKGAEIEETEKFQEICTFWLCKMFTTAVKARAKQCVE